MGIKNPSTQTSPMNVVIPTTHLETKESLCISINPAVCKRLVMIRIFQRLFKFNSILEYSLRMIRRENRVQHEHTRTRSIPAKSRDAPVSTFSPSYSITKKIDENEPAMTPRHDKTSS